MNERIKEMAKLANIWTIDNTDYPLASYIPPEFIEKFAELIIKQCGYHADIFSAAGCPVDMDPTDTKPSDYIKAQFGVTK